MCRVVLCGVCLIVAAVPTFAAPVVETFTLSEIGCGRATGYAETNKIVTLGNMTHVTWLDSEGDHFVVNIRSLDRTTNIWSETVKLGGAYDNHGGPALTVDSEGYLHVVFYPHHQSFRYRKSVRPNDASEWTDSISFGSKCTYPTMMVGPDDTLYVTARTSDASKWGVKMYTKEPEGEWTESATLLRSLYNNYSHFQESLCWGPDHKTLHLMTRFYAAGSSHAIGYMKSDDFGQTWTKSDGSPIILPGTENTLDIVESVPSSLWGDYTSGATLRAGCLAVDADGTPHLLYNTMTDHGLPRQLWIATPNGDGTWDKLGLNDKCDVLPDGWGLGVPGGITINDDGRIFVTATMCSDTNYTDLWGGPPSEVVWMESSDGGETFSSLLISDVDPDSANWLPSIERPTGFNEIDVPTVMYTAGDKGSGTGDILANGVVWVSVQYPSDLPGDLDGDGMVGSADLDIVRANWGQTVSGPSEGDPSGDGTVGSDDLDIVRANWGASAVAVPEPATTVLLPCGFALLSTVIRTRRPGRNSRGLRGAAIASGR